MIEHKIIRQNYKNAFNCKECPGTNDENGCPFWRTHLQSEKDETGRVTGKERLVSSCGVPVLFESMHVVLEASNRPAEVMGHIRNAITNGFHELSQQATKMLKQDKDNG